MATERDSLSDDFVEGIVSLIPMAGPLAAPLARRLSRAVRAEHARNFSVAIKAAERMSGRTREQLAEAIEEDPRLVPMVTRLLYAAGMTGQEESLWLMGAAFGDAVREPDKLDEAEMILSAMTDLRAHHVQVLRLVATAAPPPPDSDTEGAKGVWWPAVIGNASGMREEFVILCLAGLSSAGLVRVSATWGGDAYEPTGMGLALLEVLGVLEAEKTGNGQGEQPNP